MWLYHKSQRRICSEKGRNIPIVKNRGTGICEGSVKERINLTIEVTTDVTSILCTEEGWKEEDGTELLIFKQLDSQE